MPICLGCGLHEASDGTLELQMACPTADLLTCVSGIRNNDDPNGHPEAWGYTDQWPKRFSTLLKNEANNSGSVNYGVGDNPTFLGSDLRTGSKRNTTDAGQSAGVCGTDASTASSANVEMNNGTAGTPNRNVLAYHNNTRLPIYVKVGAHAWQADLQELPQKANGGARWIGDVSLSIFEGAGDDGRRVLELDFQRAAEVAYLTSQNSPNEAAGLVGYSTDPREIDQQFASLTAAINESVTALAACARTAAEEMCAEQTTTTTTVGAGNAGLGADGWFMPCANGYTVTSPYGPRNGGFHHGIDLRAPIGTPILAPFDGVISESGPAGDCGNSITITSTASGESWRFCHLNAVGLANGTNVTTGQQIGQTGNTGRSSGPHLHAEWSPRGRGTGAANPSTEARRLYDVGCNGVDDGGGGDPVVTEVTTTRQGCDAQAIIECLAAVEATLATISARSVTAGFAILTADNPWPSNPAWLERNVQTFGKWAQTVLVMPGETLVAETRVRFSHWDRDQFSATITPNRTHSWCDSDGGSRPGQITFDAMPAAGGRQCDPDQRFLGPLKSNVGSENAPGGNVDRPLGLLGN